MTLVSVSALVDWEVQNLFESSEPGGLLVHKSGLPFWTEP
jgi:hypothetical protein